MYSKVEESSQLIRKLFYRHVPSYSIDNNKSSNLEVTHMLQNRYSLQVTHMFDYC